MWQTDRLPIGRRRYVWYAHHQLHDLAATLSGATIAPNGHSLLAPHQCALVPGGISCTRFAILRPAGYESEPATQEWRCAASAARSRVHPLNYIYIICHSP
jgi:hypothetical protein